MQCTVYESTCTLYDMLGVNVRIINFLCLLNFRTVAVHTPQTPGPSMSDSLLLYDEDQAQLRTQLVKLTRRMAVMEKEQQTIANRTMLMYSAAVGYFMLKFVWWMFRNK